MIGFGVFDIIGPVMIGPSSSHTAGALRIGQQLNSLLKGDIKSIKITLYNSFADTGEGHGTNTAIVAGVLGLSPEDSDVINSLKIAEKRGIEVIFFKAYKKRFHPNSALIIAETNLGQISCFGESLGGGAINFKVV